MVDKLLSELGARLYGSACQIAPEDVKNVERALAVNLPIELAELLVAVGGPVVFDKDVGFAPDERSGMETEDGLLDIEILYGIPAGTNGLLEKNATYREQLPCTFVAIAEAAGGNLICINRTNNGIYFWIHDAVSVEDQCSQIAENYVKFREKLQVRASSPGSKLNKIIASETFLNF